MKYLFGTITGIFSTLVFQATALAGPATTAASPSGGLPNAGVSWPTVLILTLAVFLIFAGAIKFFKAFE